MPWRRKPVPARRPHPDPRTEAQLQRILGLRAAIGRQEDLIAEYLAQMACARQEQDSASYELRRAPNSYRRNFDMSMGAQAARVQAASAGIKAAEAAIASRHDEIDTLIAKLDDCDLAYL